MTRRARHFLRIAGVLLAVLHGLGGGAGPARAQSIGLPGASNELPVEIEADGALEWQRNASAYIARGNARARQGDVEVRADRLVAYYREEPGGRTRIWRIDADGNVRIVSPDQIARGKKAVYDVDQGVMVLTGSPRLDAADQRITARDALEYWERRGLVVARGDAVATEGDRTVRADVMTGHLAKGPDGRNRLSRIDAIDNVVVTTPGEVVRARQGVYNLNSGIVTLRGSVKITRGKNQLNGEYAEVNLKTGVSRIVAGGDRRVRGIFQPERSGR